MDHLKKPSQFQGADPSQLQEDLKSPPEPTKSSREQASPADQPGQVAAGLTQVDPHIQIAEVDPRIQAAGDLTEADHQAGGFKIPDVQRPTKEEITDWAGEVRIE